MNKKSLYRLVLEYNLINRRLVTAEEANAATFLQLITIYNEATITPSMSQPRFQYVH